MSKNGLMFEDKNLAENTVAVVLGPTASGKSDLAIELALKYDGIIINADASQVYKGIPIISAAPNDDDISKAEHKLYGIFAPQERGSVSEWLKLATAEIRKTWQINKLPIVVGGTGFYIESLINGISPIPQTSDEVRKKVVDILEKEGLQAVFAKLQEVDEIGAKMVNPNDTTRVRRALEIFWDTKKSIAEWFDKPLVRPLPEARFSVTAILPKLKDLEEKCSVRFDQMLERGALQEVENLLKAGIDENMPVMKAIGVAELGAYLQGKISLDEAVNLAKLHTRQYAKRQLTWFRNRLKNLTAARVSIITEI